MAAAQTMKPRHFIGLLIAGTTLAVEAPAPFRIRVVDTYFETDFDWENASQTREPGHRTRAPTGKSSNRYLASAWPVRSITRTL